MAGQVRCSRSGPVATLLIDNPSQRNALTPEMLAQIAALIPELEQDMSLRCLILRGNEGMFSSGYAIDHIGGSDELPYPDEIDQVCRVLEGSRLVVTAVLERFAVGAALDLVCACDFRFAQAGTRLGITPAKLGLIYSAPGIARVARVVGLPATRELFLTGRLIDADRALSLGLVSEVLPDRERLDEAVQVFAAEVSALAPLSLAGTKRVLYELAQANLLPDKIARDLHQLRVTAMDSEDAATARLAFAEKRVPEFKGR